MSKVWLTSVVEDHQVLEVDVDSDVALERETQEYLAPRYRVVLLNDDFTPMDFVTRILKMFFGMNEAQARQIMMAVHTEGRATCGEYSKDVAETKTAQVNAYSRKSQHPLLCVVERI